MDSQLDAKLLLELIQDAVNGNNIAAQNALSDIMQDNGKERLDFPIMSYIPNDNPASDPNRAVLLYNKQIYGIPTDYLFCLDSNPIKDSDDVFSAFGLGINGHILEWYDEDSDEDAEDVARRITAAVKFIEFHHITFKKIDQPADWGFSLDSLFMRTNLQNAFQLICKLPPEEWEFEDEEDEDLEYEDE